MLSIDYGFGFFGAFVITVIITAAVIVGVFLFVAAKDARDSVVSQDEDRRIEEGREDHTGPIA